MREGGHGYGGVSANCYPWVHVWLMQNYATKAQLAERVQRFLTVAEAQVKTKYPQSAKVGWKRKGGGGVVRIVGERICVTYTQASTHARTKKGRENAPVS